LKYWFRPWENAAKGDYTIPDYSPGAGYKEGFYGGENWKQEYQQTITYNGTKTVGYDTAFKNIVINDSLPFRHIGNGIYEYSNPAFFPLDNKGFGNEWNHEKGNNDQPLNVDHNYSFTMELHYKFVKSPGMTFSFSGDDDVWVYLNKQLQIDLGGIHQEQVQSFSVDNISGLQNGKSYELDFFYAERHSAESHIKITTNIIFSPSNLRIYKNPGTPNTGGNNAILGSDTVSVNTPATYYGRVFDSLGVWQPQFDKLTKWDIDNSTAATISGTSGESVTITLLQNTPVTLVGTFKDPTNPTIPESKVRIVIYPRRVAAPGAYTLKLYGKDGAPDLNGNVPLGESITVTAGTQLPVWGHLFDSSGVWLKDFDQYIKWRLLDNSQGNTLDKASGVHTMATLTKSGSSTVLVATFNDPVTLSRQPSEARLSIKVLPDAPKRLEIIEDSVPRNFTGDDKFTEVVLGKGSATKKVYAILRDKYENFISLADAASWRSENQFSIVVNPTSGKFTVVSRAAGSNGDSAYIVASYGQLYDSLKVVNEGNASIVAIPNKFSPGATLPTIIPGTNAVITSLYIPGNQEPKTGTIILIETPNTLSPLVSSGNTFAKVIIYDAVGNIVRSDLQFKVGANSRIYGLVWDGKNMNGRDVASGTYLIDVYAKMANGKPFNEKTKVGVTRGE
ncbi:MAG TPA: fibro-slime domain-containing protein, partial [Chitinispirillaceae bacterium]|nr:fibro-slime domain-containing protein [Chitinispirillaceae bacterium]